MRCQRLICVGAFSLLVWIIGSLEGVEARRFILRSGPQSPPACARPQSSLNATATSLSTPTLAPNTPSTSIASATVSVNASIPVASATVTASENGTSVDNSTIPDNSTSADTTNTTVAARASKRHGNAQTELLSFVQEWQNLCVSSGGDIFSTEDPCVELGQIDALLAHANPCDQQDIADAMITFAKSDYVVNPEELIAYAVEYRKHARSTIEILGVIPSSPYCLKAPINPELDGIFNEQIEGADLGLFGGPSYPIVPFGAAGTCPFGYTADVSTCSCMAGSSTNVTGTEYPSNSANSTSIDGTDSSVGNSTVSYASSGNSSVSEDSTDAATTTTSTNTDATDVSSSVQYSVATTSESSISATSASTDDSETSTDAITSQTSSAATSTDTPSFDGNINDPAGP